jgi:hypothetical protein
MKLESVKTLKKNCIDILQLLVKIMGIYTCKNLVLPITTTPPPKKKKPELNKRI